MELTYFRTGIDNVIGYKKRTGDLDASTKFPATQQPTAGKEYSQQANRNEYRTTGVEFYSKLIVIPELYFTVRGGYNKAEKNVNNNFERLEYGQQYYGLFSVNYKLFKKYNFNLTGRYTSDKLVPKKDFKETGNDYNPTEDKTLSADPYFILNLSIWAENVFVDGFDISLKLDNILNQRYYDAGREVLYPQTTMRFWGTLQYKF